MVSVPSIAHHITAELLSPEFYSSSWHCGVSTTLMAVPETAMHEDACLVLSEHNIWLPDQRPYVESKPEALGVQQFSNFQFGPGILPPNLGHHA